MHVVNATEARGDFFNLIKGALENHQIYQIHHREGDVVLLSSEEYESLIETLELLSIPGMKVSLKQSVAEVKAGDTRSMEDLFGKKV